MTGNDLGAINPRTSFKKNFADTNRPASARGLDVPRCFFVLELRC
jgi:hypothetical protein